MTMPVEELDTAGQLKTFVEHNASDFITKAGNICSSANCYSSLTYQRKQKLFKECKEMLKMLKKVGKLVQEDICDG